MIRLRELSRYRDRAWERSMGGEGDDLGGCFVVPTLTGAKLRCIASNDAGWDHVSVSVSLPRCPTWMEMDHIKRLFFRPDEVVMQLHPAEGDHISMHPYTLHLWRPHGMKIPLPPKDFV